MLRRPPQLPAHFVALSFTAVPLGLSFPLPGWSFLAWVALVPAGWLAATSRRPWTLAWTSAVVLGVWWVWMLRWLWPVTLPGAVATAVFQSLFWVAALWATNVVVRKKRWPITVVLPVMWVALEWLRGTFPFGGFGWFMLGHTQGAWEAGWPGMWTRLAELVGAWGLTLVLAYVSAVCVTLLKTRQKRVAALHAGIMVLLFVLAFLFDTRSELYWKVRRPEWREFVPIALVQTNAPHSNKLSPTVAAYEQDFAELSRLHAEAAGVLTGQSRERERPVLADADPALTLGALSDGDAPALIVWPETVVPGKFNDEAASAWRAWALNQPDEKPDTGYFKARTAMPFRARELIARFGIPTVVGASTELPGDGPDHDRDHNSAYLVDGGGVAVARYDKLHRVPFGEYIPGPAWLKHMLLRHFSPYGDYDYSLDPGEAVTVFILHLAPGASPGAGEESRDAEANGGRPRVLDPGLSALRFATPICFEDTVGRLCRRMVYDPDTGAKRVDVLVNLTTDGWFGELPSADEPGGGLGWRSMRLQHLQIASLRAIENRVPVVRSVNTGVSAVIDSNGRIIAAAEPGEATVVRGTVMLDGRRTLYAIVGDVPIMVMSGGAGVLLLWALLTKPARPRRCRRVQ